MAVSGIGKMAAKATGSAAGLLNELIGSGAYPAPAETIAVPADELERFVELLD